MDWIHLAQDRDQWPVLVNTVMNISGPTHCWEFHEWMSNCQLLKKDSAPRSQ
jgi:hypothetical protein